MTLTTESIADVVDELLAEISPADAALYRPRFNVAPSDLHWIVGRGDAGRRILLPAVWGYLAGSRALINVRATQCDSGQWSLLLRQHRLAPHAQIQAEQPAAGV